MNNEPLVSIAVPIYGVEKYIERCAKSLFEQTYPNIEYVFVDDCSPDSSARLLERMIEQYPERKGRIVVIHHAVNRGLAAARNTAIQNCSGEFVSHVDSDDYLENTAIELLVKKQIEGDYDIVSGNAIRHMKESSILLEEPDYESKFDMLRELVKPNLNHVIWRRLIRLSLYRDYSIEAFEEVDIGEDWQVMPKLVYFSNSYGKLGETIYHYDCTNDNSYMSVRGNYKKLRIKSICDIKSLSLLYFFFKEREPVITKDIQTIYIEKLGYAYSLYCKCLDFKTYKQIKEYFDPLAISFLKEEHWLLRLSYRFRRNPVLCYIAILTDFLKNRIKFFFL